MALGTSVEKEGKGKKHNQKSSNHLAEKKLSKFEMYVLFASFVGYKICSSFPAEFGVPFLCDFRPMEKSRCIGKCTNLLNVRQLFYFLSNLQFMRLIQ